MSMRGYKNPRSGRGALSRPKKIPMYKRNRNRITRAYLLSFNPDDKEEFEIEHSAVSGKNRISK